MKIMRKISVFLPFLLIVYFLVSPYHLEPASEKNLTIGMVLSNLENPFFQAMNTGAQTEAALHNINLKVLDSDDSSELELEMIKRLINEDIDLLVINPADSDAVYPAVRYANLKQIPVITVDRVSTGGQIICHIASNNEDGGKLAAEFILNRANNVGEYAILRGIEGTSASLMRNKGFQKKMVTNGQMTLVTNMSASFDRELGKLLTEKILKVHPNLKALFAENDEMALGAIEAIRERNRQEIIVVGFDGTPEARLAIQKGDMTATVTQQPELLGAEAIRQALAFFQKKSIPETVFVDVKLLTKD